MRPPLPPHCPPTLPHTHPPISTHHPSTHPTPAPHCQINYCEEQVECRRVLMLNHFGEGGFTRAHCRATCDNCAASQGQALGEEDVTEAAKKGAGAAGWWWLWGGCWVQSSGEVAAACCCRAPPPPSPGCARPFALLCLCAHLVPALTSTPLPPSPHHPSRPAVVEVVRCIGGASVGHVVDVFRGNNTVGVRRAGHERAREYGAGRALCRNNGEAERLVRRMVVQGLLTEETHRPETHLAVISTLSVRAGGGGGGGFGGLLGPARSHARWCCCVPAHCFGCCPGCLMDWDAQSAWGEIISVLHHRLPICR